MTYAEKLAIDVLNIRDRHGSMEEIVERINQAMQAQREACAQAVRNELVAYEEYVIRAILNAEVKI